MTIALQDVDHLVIGGGPAGSMVAMRLAAAGRHVVLIEKEREAHHKVCGEFLSREAIGYLHQAGIDPLQLGAAVIRSLRLSAGSKVVESPLPFHALSLSRRVLDEALLARAAEKGCRILRGVAAESLTTHGTESTAALSSGQSLRSSTVFLATGKHDLRGFSRSPSPQSDLIGFKLHWRLAPTQILALRERIDLFLFSGGYGGLTLVEEDAANLCLVVRRSVFRTMGGCAALLAAIRRENHHLLELLQNGKPLWSRPLAISPIPYGYLAANSTDQHIVATWCVGDQAAVIPSFTGDGVSIALHSSALAAQMFLAERSAAEYHRTLHAQLRPAMSLATWLSRAAVTGPARALAPHALALFPRALQWIASSTRIPQSTLLVNEYPSTNAGNAAHQSA